MRARTALAVALCAAVGASLALAGAASAALLRPLERTIPVSMANPAPAAIAVDSEDNVYVLQPNETTVEKHDSTGAPSNFGFPACIDPEAFCYITENRLYGTPDGMFHYGFFFNADLAIDNSGGPADGHLYVTDAEDSQGIDVFDSVSGEFLGYIRPGLATPDHGGTACSVDVDQSTGDIYVGFESGHIDRFKVNDANPNSDSFVAQIRNLPEPPCKMAVDRSGNVYVGEPGEVVKYPPAAFGPPLPPSTSIDVGAQVTPTSIAIDPDSQALVVDEGNQISEYDSSGKPQGTYGDTLLVNSKGVAVEHDRVYASSAEGFGAPKNDVSVFGTAQVYPDAITKPVTDLLRETVTLNGEAGPATGAPVTECEFRWGTDLSYGNNAPCSPATPYSALTDVSASLSGLTPGVEYHYRLFVTSANGTNFGRDFSFVAPYVGGVHTDPASAVGRTSATLNGRLDTEGIPTQYFFEYGVDGSYGQKAPATPLTASLPAGTQSVSVNLTKLQVGTEYHFRLVAFETAEPELKTFGNDQTVIPSIEPQVGAYVTDVNTDGVVLHGEVNPNGLPTVYHFEYGLDTGYGTTIPLPDMDIGSPVVPQDVINPIKDLKPGTVYHYKVVAKNDHGTVQSPDRTFTTFSLPDLLVDTCPNALERQQTSAALLPDCRAYEIVSAADAGGHDVESDLDPNGEPYGGYPYATAPSRALYAIKAGGVPGVGNPTNFGPSPYLATRGDDGWTTTYVGIPADAGGANGPFASVLGQADASLDTFAFAGPGICSPCFPGGGTGLPLRTPQGALVQGMAGSLSPGPSAALGGYVRRYLSADGVHLVFGSTAQFEPDGAANGTDVSIYDRNLSTGVTQVVSKTPAGSTMTGAGIGSLDLSADGSRIVVAAEMSSDADGNRFGHPYMHVGSSPATLDLARGSTAGDRFAGMTADGSRFYFTSDDELGADDDTSADLFVTTVEGGTSSDPEPVSTGSGNACDPVANSAGPHWNSTGAGPSCDVVPIAGGGGVAAGDGTVAFLTPQALGGEGTADQPNLFIARPGAAPELVATLEPDNPIVLHALDGTDQAQSGDFELTANGKFAVFVSTLPLNGFDNGGFNEAYRFATGSGELTCASCSPTGARTVSDTGLASNGSSVSEDGRVFYTSADPLALRDNNGRKDVYEWGGGQIDLISGGTGTSDSGLLSVSADGVDAYFFTRDKLAEQDEGSHALKIYDARVGGGFFAIVPRKPCAASDECHGPGTEAPASQPISTIVGKPAAKPNPISSCKNKHFVKRKGKCVKKKAKKPAKKRGSRR